MMEGLCSIGLVPTRSDERTDFKLVEAPYLGMEHQSSVTIGNELLQMAIRRKPI